ncbi:MAG: aminodeoxychorismate/anthranilate synthase component II, partial [Rhodospirillales bacterium]|nr:aminodeoxychorismate/anthranilate synthase component II [Rhodospirillales bacterium]
HQSIGQATGGEIVRAEQLMHGKTDRIHHDGQGLFHGLPNPFIATRYHSLVILPHTFDEEHFEKSAWTDEGEIMGLRARPGVLGDAPLEGVQFHPESFLTDAGPHLLANFLGLQAPAAARPC